MNTAYKNLEFILEGLISRYKERVPDVDKIVNGLLKEGILKSESAFHNDHIAFRTMGVPHLGIASMEKIFLHYGYEKKEYLYFEEKKLNAYWFHPPKPEYPRIFISELRVADLTPSTQKIIVKYTNEVKSDPVDALDLDDPKAVDRFLHDPLWTLPTLSDYKALLIESEYAAWTIYNRYYLNHFTISVHELTKCNDLESFNIWLENNGIQLNDSGGKIKKSPDGLLWQSATVAQMIEATFLDNEKMQISGSYVEFAERKVLPEFSHLPKEAIRREHRRDGFEAKNADKIFESTYTSQTTKK
jgi:hypothetical protein